MKINSIRPMLYTEYIHETIDFYTSVLEFELGEINEEWGWASLHKDGLGIMLAKPNDHMEFTKPKFTGSFYFNVLDVESIWNSLKSRVNIVYPIETFEWQMREFAIYDNNGYVLQFGQDMTS